jgi:hypothetical protein
MIFYYFTYQKVIMAAALMRLLSGSVFLTAATGPREPSISHQARLIKKRPDFCQVTTNAGRETAGPYFLIIHVLNFRCGRQVSRPAALQAILMETVYFENDHVILYYDPSRRLGRAVWYGFMSGDDFRSNLNTSLRLIEDKNPALWLADNRKMKAIRQKDQEWFEKEVMPRLGTSSIRKMATLISEDIFNQMAVENLYTRSNKIIHFEHQFFNEEQQALAWLTATRTKETPYH